MSGAREQVHFVICGGYSQRRSHATARIVKCKLTSTSWLVSALEFLPRSLSVTDQPPGLGRRSGSLGKKRKELIRKRDNKGKLV